MASIVLHAVGIVCNARVRSAAAGRMAGPAIKPHDGTVRLHPLGRHLVKLSLANKNNIL